MRHFIKIVEAFQYEMFPPDSLYHTTSPGAAFDILSSRMVRPATTEGFASFSERPHLHDIQAHGAVIVFNLRQLYAQIEPVEYTEAWARENPAQADYIAGEGWTAQFHYEPEYDNDDDEYDDTDAEDAAYADAALEAFLQKSNEDEWISLRPGQPVHFATTSVTALILNESLDDESRNELAKLGYAHVKIMVTD